MNASKLKNYLDENKIKYRTIQHSVAYTAQEIAARAHIPGKELAKTVMIKIDGKMAMIVVPASHKIDVEEIKDIVESESVRIASEQEFKDKFPDCEVGAMPPFGNLYAMDVFVSATLTEDEEIAFNAGSHSELIKMDFKDFERLVQPKIVHASFLSRL